MWQIVEVLPCINDRFVGLCNINLWEFNCSVSSAYQSMQKSNNKKFAEFLLSVLAIATLATSCIRHGFSYLDAEDQSLILVAVPQASSYKLLHKLLIA